MPMKIRHDSPLFRCLHVSHTSHPWIVQMPGGDSLSDLPPRLPMLVRRDPGRPPGTRALCTNPVPVAGDKSYGMRHGFRVPQDEPNNSTKVSHLPRPTTSTA